MNKTHKKLALIAISAFVVEAALVVGVATNFNAMALNPIKASNTDYSVTFSRSASTVESGSYASGVATISSKLSGGTKVYADIYGQTYSLGNNIVRFSGETDQYVKFYFSGSSVQNFESISSLDFTYSTSTGDFDIYYSAVPIDFNDSSTYYVYQVSSAPASVNLGVSGVHYVALHSRNSAYAYIQSVKINYTCGEPSSKTLSSISVSGQQTEFTQGDAFVFGGTVTAHYNDSSTEDVTSSATFSGYDMTTAGEQTVTVSYTEDLIQVSTTYTITVEGTGGLSGTYSSAYTSLEFTSSTAGTYTYGSEKLYFSYVVDGTKITFTYVSGDNTSFGSYRLFAGGSSPKVNSTGSIVSNSQISVKTYNMFDSATSRTFTKS